MSSTNIASLSGPMTLDGISVVAGNRVLLTGQTTASQNGIWVVQSGAWTRPSDFAVGASAAGTAVFVEEGTINAEQGWICSTVPGSDIIGTNSLAYTQFTGVGDLTAGNGLAKSGNTLAVSLATNSGLQFVGGNLSTFPTSTGGLQATAAGLSILLNANNTLLTDASGLRVLGLPSLFTVNSVAVGSSVTAANLTALTAGSTSYVDSLHNHAFAAGAMTTQNQLTNGPTALAIADPVYPSSTANTLGRADAASDATANVIGVAAAATAASALATYIACGPLAAALSGATPGTRYWLNTGGGITTTPPSGVGVRRVRVGFALSSTALFVKIQDFGTLIS